MLPNFSLLERVCIFTQNFYIYQCWQRIHKIQKTPVKQIKLYFKMNVFLNVFLKTDYHAQPLAGESFMPHL